MGWKTGGEDYCTVLYILDMDGWIVLLLLLFCLFFFLKKKKGWDEC